MLSAIMAMAVLLDSPSSPDPASLVNQLGSSRYALRISAEGELVRLGRMALPALRAGKNSKDAEIRARSVALVSRIENSLLLQPTPIGLDFGDVRLTDAIQKINQQTGLNLALSPLEGSRVASRRINLQWNEPLPFWRAIDALCLAANLHPAPRDESTQGILDGSFPLLDGPITDPGLISDHGPFRVQLSSVHAQSAIRLGLPRPAHAGQGSPTDNAPTGPRPVVQANKEFFLQFLVAAEPTLAITRRGPVKLTKVVDDRGQSLGNPAVPGNFQHSEGYFGMSPSSMLHFRLDLNYPDSQARQIRILQGSIPVLVATRKPDPLVVPLAESRGKLLRSNQVALTLLDHRPALNHQPATIEIAVTPLGEPVEPNDPGNGEPLGFRPDSFRQQIEILDAQGQVLSWFPSATFYNGEETRLTMTVASLGNPGEATTLRYHGILKASTEVAFEFRDIPIP